MRIEAFSRFVKTILPSVALALLLGACGTSVQNAQPVSALSQAGIGQPATGPYVLAPGDELTVKFFYNPELNEEEVFVRPDGNISLQLVGETQAAGLTPGELETRLEQTYGKHLRQADVAVLVNGFLGQRVYVSGEVGEPGVVQMFGRTTVLQSIAAAGGFTKDATKQQVILVRRGAQEPVVVTLDVEKVLEGTDSTQDAVLMPYDVVYVPRSTIANVNLFIQQYIKDNIPIPFGLGYSLNN